MKTTIRMLRSSIVTCLKKKRNNMIKISSIITKFNQVIKDEKIKKSCKIFLNVRHA